MAKHKSCLQVIPNAYVACGEGGQYCSAVCMLLAALEPFAKTATAHGVNKPTKDDLWVSLGVASSAWVNAMKAFNAADSDKGCAEVVMTERQMFEQSFKRPRNYFKLSPEEQWAIDKRLGILDWEGDGLTEEDKQRIDAHYEK